MLAQLSGLDPRFHPSRRTRGDGLREALLAIVRERRVWVAERMADDKTLVAAARCEKVAASATANPRSPRIACERGAPSPEG